MHDITLECAMKTLKRVDMMTSVIQVLAELLKEEPMELLEEALKLDDAVIEAIKKAKEIKKEQQ